MLTITFQINAEATPVLYSRPIRFDTPATLMTFFANLESSMRPHLRHVELRTYVKKDAKTALVFLAEAKGLEHLRIEVGVAAEDDVSKAAGAFWTDVCKLLEAVGTRIEKSMVPPRKARLPEPKVEEKDESEEESDEDEKSEEEDEDEDDNETEETDESAKSDPAEASDSKEDVAKSDPAEATDNKEVVKSDEPTEMEGLKTEGAETADQKPADIKAEESTTVDDIEKPADTNKKDSKSPAPVAVAPIKKKATVPEPPKLIQGQKCFAVDILNFGKQAFKNKDGSAWDKTKKQKFLDLLEAKLK